MKVAGIILIVLQVLAILGGIVNGTLVDIFSNLGNARGIGQFVGFFLIGVI